MSSQYDQNQAQVAYPPPSTAPGNYAAPPPPGYPTKDGSAPSQNAPIETKSRGEDGFWKGCCAALCCCCVLDCCL